MIWTQNTCLPVPEPPSTFAGGITLRPQTSVWGKESCIFYNSTQYLCSGLTLTGCRKLYPQCFCFLPHAPRVCATEPASYPGERGAHGLQVLCPPTCLLGCTSSRCRMCPWQAGAPESLICVSTGLLVYLQQPAFRQGLSLCSCHPVRKLFKKQTNKQTGIRDTCWRFLI